MTNKKSDKPVLTELGPKEWRAIVDKRYVGYGKTAESAFKAAKKFANVADGSQGALMLARHHLSQANVQIDRLSAEVAHLKHSVGIHRDARLRSDSVCRDAEMARDKMRDQVKALRAEVKEMQPFFRDDKWVAERINHYNQACIDWIWCNKELPEYITYRRLMGLVT